MINPYYIALILIAAFLTYRWRKKGLTPRQVWHRISIVTAATALLFFGWFFSLFLYGYQEVPLIEPSMKVALSEFILVVISFLGLVDYVRLKGLK